MIENNDDEVFEKLKEIQKNIIKLINMMFFQMFVFFPFSLWLFADYSRVNIITSNVHFSMMIMNVWIYVTHHKLHNERKRLLKIKEFDIQRVKGQWD